MRVDADRIVRLLEKEADRPLSLREIAETLGYAKSERKALQRAVRRLVADGSLYRLRGRRFAVPGRVRLTVGRLQTIRSGSAFLIPDERGEDVFVRAGDLGSALDGDRVAVRVEGRGRKGRLQGRVVEVLERSRRTIVGRYHDRVPGGQRGERRAGARLGWVVPEDPALPSDVIVTADESAGDLAAGDMVVVRIEDWGDAHRGPAGIVERILGRPDDPGVDVLAILHAHELPVEFPPEASSEAERLRGLGVREADVRGRTDLRDLYTFTIDPEDAKDHDDALSWRELGEGRVEVGVHIADVSHYVREGSALDAEAAARGTSVYLVDRAIPMLPSALSSDLCSLVPGEDRLTLSVLFEVDGSGAVTGAQLAETVIRSRHRLTYAEVQAVLDGREAISPEADGSVRELMRFATRLRAERKQRGSLDFDLPEARVLLDPRGEPIAIQRYPRYDSHRLVEDLMLLANETVGARATRAGIAFLYRIHEPPDEVGVEQVRELARALGYTPPPPGRLTPGRLQQLLEQAMGRPEGPMFSTLVLRAMKQACYSEADAGHFGLATKAYTHFTSPIRRYPDLVVHRIVRAQLLGGPSGRGYEPGRLRQIARRSSDRERVAQSAERDSISLKKMRFMARQVGEEFDGTISDVRPFGFFVLLDAHFVEGLVHVSALGDDYYQFVEERFVLKGEHGGRRFTLGQRVRVRVASVDEEERRIDFVLAREDAPRDRRDRRAPRRQRRRKKT